MSFFTSSPGRRFMAIFHGQITLHIICNCGYSKRKLVYTCSSPGGGSITIGRTNGCGDGDGVSDMICKRNTIQFYMYSYSVLYSRN